MSYKKELDNKQAEMLFRDILKGDVKRLGPFRVGKYDVHVYTQGTSTTNAQRVRALYHRRKSKHLCIQCSSHVSDGQVRCKKCRNKYNLSRRKK